MTRTIVLIIILVYCLIDVLDLFLISLDDFKNDHGLLTFIGHKLSSCANILDFGFPWAYQQD